MKNLVIEKFIQKARQIHGNKYDYTSVIYINNDVKVIIKCPIHGEYTITPKNHLHGQKCKQCGYIERNNKRTVADDYIEKVKIVHQNKYDYSETFYTTARNKITIICPIHGKFIMRGANHINGQGCGKCNNYRSGFSKSQWMRGSGSRDGIFYIIKCYGNNEEFYKLGITFRSVELRYGKKKKGTGSLLPYQYEIIKEIKSNDLEYIWKLEKRFKLKKRNQKYTPLIKFPGSTTKCFTV